MLYGPAQSLVEAKLDITLDWGKPLFDGGKSQRDLHAEVSI